MGDETSTAASFMDAVSDIGPFAVGSVFGAAVFWFAGRQAAAERKKEADIRLEREKELYRQLNLKDDRINKLHERLNPPKTPLQKPKK